MSGKMTDKALELLQTQAAVGSHCLWNNTAMRKVIAHIAALTAERDCWQQKALNRDLEVTRVVGERDAFRADLVRVTEFAYQGGTAEPVTQEGRNAIEAVGRLLAERDEADVNETRAWSAAQTNADERAAIHQRAEMWKETNRLDCGTHQAIDFILGGKAPSNVTREDERRANGLKAKSLTPEARLAGKMALASLRARTNVPETCTAHQSTSEPDGQQDVDPRTFGDVVPPAESATAEAFEMVRDTLSQFCDKDTSMVFVRQTAPSLLAAIALLERRMGVMGRALRNLLAPGHTPDTYSAAMENCCAALTDAPEVYTREEVARVLGDPENDIDGPTQQCVLQSLIALRRKA